MLSNDVVSRPSSRPTTTTTSSQNSSSNAVEDDSTQPAGPSQFEIAQNGGEELSQLRSQLATRRDFERKRGAVEDNFDHVLENDVPGKIRKIVALAQSGTVSVDELLRYAMTLFPDETDLILILRELLENKKLKEAALAKVTEALEIAEAQSSPKRVKAGANVAYKARLHGARMAANPAALRACYRQFLENPSLRVALYQGWVEDFGVERRAQVVDFIEAALFADMHAQDPSCSRLEFGEMLQGMRTLRQLRSSDERFVLVLQAAWALQAESSVMLLLAVLQRPFELKDLLFEHLGEDVRRATLRRRSQLLQALLRGFKGVPVEMFDMEEARDAVLESLAGLADQAYALECRSRGS